jgi:hypothetical protein
MIVHLCCSYNYLFGLCRGDVTEGRVKAGIRTILITCDRLAIDSTTNIYTGVKLYRLQDNTTRSVLLSTHCIGAIGRGNWMLICF